MAMIGNKRGSITIFLIIVFMAFLVLTGVLIDAARIKLAGQQLQGALDSAVRSTMADCHQGMSAEYGIYGGALDEKKIAGFLAANLNEKQGALNFIKYNNILVEVDESESVSLLQNNEFRRQMLQYMKYKGPLLCAENLIEMIKGYNFNRNLAVLEQGQREAALKNNLNEQGIEESTIPSTDRQFDLDSSKNNYKEIIDFIKNNLTFMELSDQDLINEREFSSAAAESSISPAEQFFAWGKEDSLENEGHKVGTFLNRMKLELEGLASAGRDRIFQAEYVLDKYTYLTSGTKREHFFKKGEIEYILCGNYSELKNLSAVFERIWFWRFATNVLDNFCKCALTDPLSRLSFALTEGFTRACSDTLLIYDGKSVPLFPDTSNIQMCYSDYMRMFLLLQDGDVQLNRMRQLIQVNMRKEHQEEGFNLAFYQCKGKVRAKAEMNLWFLPAQAFSNWKTDRVKDGKLIIEKETAFSY